MHTYVTDFFLYKRLIMEQIVRSTRCGGAASTFEMATNAK